MKLTIKEFTAIRGLVVGQINVEKRCAQRFIDGILENTKARKKFKDESEYLEHRNKLVRERLETSEQYNLLLGLREKIEKYEVEVKVE